MAIAGDRHRGARVLLVAACVVVVVAGLRAAAPVLLPILVAVFLAILSLPLMRLLQRYKIPTEAAVPLTVLANVALVAGLLWLVSGTLNEFVERAPSYREQLDRKQQQALDWLERRNVDTSDWLSPGEVNMGVVLSYVRTGITSVTFVLSNFVLVLLTLAFILLEASYLPAKLRVAFRPHGPPGKLVQVIGEVQNYFALKTFISLLTGLLIGFWTWFLGIDFFVLWGVLAFVLNFIPNIGSVIAAVPAVVVALAQYDLQTALIVALGYLAVNMVMGNMIEPRLMGRSLGLSTLVVFVSLLFWGWVWGPIGMLLSVPLTMFVRILAEHTDDLHWLAILLAAKADEEDLVMVTTRESA